MNAAEFATEIGMLISRATAGGLPADEVGLELEVALDRMDRREKVRGHKVQYEADDTPL